MLLNFLGRGVCFLAIEIPEQPVRQGSLNRNQHDSRRLNLSPDACCPMKIAGFLKPESIKLDLVSSSKCPAIREVAELLLNDPRILDFKKLYDEILARERSNPTLMDNEVAFPHARIDQLSDMVVAVGRSAKGVDFEGKGQPTVKLIFVIGTPKRMVTEYLRLVGSLARVLKQDETRRRLLETTDPFEFLRIIGETENQL